MTLNDKRLGVNLTVLKGVMIGMSTAVNVGCIIAADLFADGQTGGIPAREIHALDLGART